MLKNILSSLKKIKKASKYADCKNSGKELLWKYYGVKTERRDVQGPGQAERFGKAQDILAAYRRVHSPWEIEQKRSACFPDFFDL